MRYIDFARHFKAYPLITYQDIRNKFGNVSHSQLIGWQKQGFLVKLKRGIFTLADNQVDMQIIANHLNYSYISTEYALSHYQMIPDVAQVITSVSRDRNEKISNTLGNFSYRKIYGELFTGYSAIQSLNSPNFSFRIATPEKALFDLVYLRADLKEVADFESLRLALPKNFHKADLKKYLAVVKAPQLRNRLENLIKFLYASV